MGKIKKAPIILTALGALGLGTLIYVLIKKKYW